MKSRYNKKKVEPLQIVYTAPNPMIFDIGSGSTRVGFQGENKPEVIFPTMISY